MGVGADGFRGRLKWKRKSKSAWLAALEGMGVRSVFLWKTDLTPGFADRSQKSVEGGVGLVAGA